MYMIVMLCLFWNLNEMLSLGILYVYVIAFYGGTRGIYNGKSWMKAMRLFQSVAAALLQRLLSIRQNAFDDIEQYFRNSS